MRIERTPGVEMDTLVRMRASFDIARTRKPEADIGVERYRAQEART